MHINFPLLLNDLQKSELNQGVAEYTWSRLSKSSNNAESLRKSKKDAKAMLPDPTHKPAIDWAYSKFPNDNWAMWFLRNYKQDPSLFNEKNKTDLEHFAGMAATSKDIGDHRFDKAHDFNKGVADLKEKESSWQAKQGDKLVDKKGQQIIDLGNGLGWWDLGVGSCEAEGAAMGHCGNTAAVEQGDRILSLRQQKGNKYEPNLTFIENSGWLGEMKGRANEKPAAKYHGAIKTLLEHPRIKHIAGGGYADEMNFHMGDLPDDVRKDIENKKPDLDLTASNDPETLRNTAKHLSDNWRDIPEKHRALDKLIDLKADEIEDANGKSLDQHLIDKYVNQDDNSNSSVDMHDIFKLINKTPENINEFAKSPNTEMQDLGLVHPLSGKEYLDHLFSNPNKNARDSLIMKHKALDSDRAKVFAKTDPVIIYERPDLFNKDDIHDIIHSKEYGTSAKNFAAGHPEVSQDDLFHAATDEKALYEAGPDRILKHVTRETLDKLSNHYKNKQGPYRSVREAIALHPNADPAKTTECLKNVAAYNKVFNNTQWHATQHLSQAHSDELLDSADHLSSQAYNFPNASPEKVIQSLKNFGTQGYGGDDIAHAISRNNSLRDEHLASLISSKKHIMTNNLFTHKNSGPETLKAWMNHPHIDVTEPGRANDITNHPSFGPTEAEHLYNKIQSSDSRAMDKDMSIAKVFLHPKTSDDLKHKIIDTHPSMVAGYSAYAPQALTPEMSKKLIDNATPSTAHELLYSNHPALDERSIKDLVDKHGSDSAYGDGIKKNADRLLDVRKGLQKSLRSRYEKLKR